MQQAKFKHSTILFPCHSWEDFPLHHRDEKADGLLDCWISLWHPRLLLETNAIPSWQRADEPQEDLADTLVVIPEVSNSWLPTGFAPRAARQQAKLITGETCRWKVLQRAFPESDLKQDDVGVNDFLALGYAYLQVKLMTHQLRSSSNLDETKFTEALLQAAKSWEAKSNANEPTNKLLTNCYDLLLEEKNCYYPVEPELIDFVLVAKSTIGDAWAAQLNSEHRFSMLADVRTLKQAKSNNPNAFEQLTQKIADKQIDLIACNDVELADPLLSPETCIHQIRLATEYCQNTFELEQRTYARRRFGLSPSLPAILDQLEFEGVLHCTLDDGKFPYSSSSNMRWEGDEGNSILALGQIPKDARQGTTFLNLGVDLGQAIDSAHVATFLLAHWPHAAHPCLTDLLNIQQYGALLGRFSTLSEYFANSYDPGYSDTYTADEYRAPYFNQAIAARQMDPISRYVRYWNQFSVHSSLRGLAVLLASVLTRLKLKHEWPEKIKSCIQRLNEIQTRIESATDQEQAKVRPDEIEAELESIQSDLLATIQSVQPSSSEDDGLVVVNSMANSQPVLLTLDSKSGRPASIKSNGAIILGTSDPEATNCIVELPAMSFTFVSPTNLFTNASDPIATEATVTTANSVRNEFFELVVDAETGALNNLNLHDRRKNLLSQQIALRIPSETDAHGHPLGQARYTKMKCNEFRVESLSRITGRITTTGQLLDGDKVVANFEQEFIVSRGRKNIDVRIKIDPTMELSDSPNHYFCSRIAWKDESAELLRNAQHVRSYISGHKFEAANYIEIVSPTAQITLFPRGLPFHRRSDRRMLDTLLIAGQESEREFRFSIGVNVPYPLAAAIHEMSPNITVPGNDLIPAVATALQNPAGKCEPKWFFHFNCRNVVATWWEPVFDEIDQMTGLRVRLRESQGRGGTLQVRSVFELASCVKTNFNNTQLSEASIEGDTASINFTSFEYFQLQLNFAK